MKQFKKLGREEMRQVNAGVEGHCNVGGLCSFFIGMDGMENGNCAVQNNLCVCVAGNGDWGIDPQCTTT